MPLVLVAATSLASCDRPPATDGVSDQTAVVAPRPAPTPPSAQSIEYRVEPVAEAVVSGSSYHGPLGVVSAARSTDENQTVSIWSLTRVSPDSAFQQVSDGLLAAPELLDWCAAKPKPCQGVRDAWLWVHGVDERAGPIGIVGLRYQPQDWRTAPTTLGEALERSELLPATPTGRAGLAQWCDRQRATAPGFCGQVDAIIAPPQ